jgi:hypothetical protein
LEELLRSIADGSPVTVRFGDDDATGAHGELCVLGLVRDTSGSLTLTARFTVIPDVPTEMTTEETITYLREGFSQYIPARFRIVALERSTA